MIDCSMCTLRLTHPQRCYNYNREINISTLMNHQMESILSLLLPYTLVEIAIYDYNNDSQKQRVFFKVFYSDVLFSKNPAGLPYTLSIFIGHDISTINTEYQYNLLDMQYENVFEYKIRITKIQSYIWYCTHTYCLHLFLLTTNSNYFVCVQYCTVLSV